MKKKRKKPLANNGAHRFLSLDPNLQPREDLLFKEVLVVLRTIHHPGSQIKPLSSEELTGAAKKRDPSFSPFYDAESRIDLIIEDRHVASIMNLQSNPEYVDRAHRRSKHYVESHLAEVIAHSVIRLCNEARDLGVVSRNDLIKRGLNEEEASMRRRLPRERKVTSPEWLAKAIKTLRELYRDEVKITPTNLAKRLFPESDNALQDLRRKLKQAPYPMGFNELLLYANLHPNQLASPGMMDMPPLSE